MVNPIKRSSNNEHFSGCGFKNGRVYAPKYLEGFVLIQQQHGRYDYSVSVWNSLPHHFDTHRPADFLRYATHIENVNLNHLTTFFLFDIRHTRAVENAIILDTQLGLRKTVQTTTQLINRAKRQLPFGRMQLLHNLAVTKGLSTYKLPVINGDARFIPLGASSRGSTNWVGCHQVTGVERLEQGMKITFFNQIEIVIPLSFTRYQRQSKEAQLLQAELQTTQAVQDQYYFSRYFDSAAHSEMSQHSRAVLIQYTKHMFRLNDLPLVPEDIDFVINSFFC